MTITIEDAPAVKHITIDIDFSAGNTTITKDGVDINTGIDTTIESTVPSTIPSYKDEALNLDEDYTQSEEEVVLKPEIIHEDRTPKVSDDMQNLEL